MCVAAAAGTWAAYSMCQRAARLRRPLTWPGAAMLGYCVCRRCGAIKRILNAARQMLGVDLRPEVKPGVAVGPVPRVLAAPDLTGRRHRPALGPWGCWCGRSAPGLPTLGDSCCAASAHPTTARQTKPRQAVAAEGAPRRQADAKRPSKTGPRAPRAAAVTVGLAMCLTRCG